MLQKTKGIVLGFIRYKESSIIARIYTRELGFQSYIVNGVRSKSAKSNKIALFQPLTLLDLVVYYHEKKSINRISEVKCSHPFSAIPFDLLKSTVAMFMGEVLNKVLHFEENPNPDLFDFIHDEIILLDTTPENLSVFHHRFLLQLLTHLGIQPLSCESMYEGIVASYQGKNKPVYPSQTENRFIDSVLNDSEPAIVNRVERRNILQFILNFYFSHIDNFGTIKSVEVLREVLE